jgi:hypothetical protein
VELALRLNSCQSFIDENNGNIGEFTQPVTPLARTNRSRPLSAIKAQWQPNDDLSGTMLDC